LEKQRREYEAFVPKRGPKKGKVCPKLPIYRFNANCELKVNEKNSWWHQIQGQLHITGREICYLYIWTPKGSKTVEIDKSLYTMQALRDFVQYKYKCTSPMWSKRAVI